MKKTAHPLLIRLAACILLAGLAGGMAAAHYISLTNYRSPLREDPPSPGPVLGSPLTRRVVFILVDALRLDTSLNQDVMPNLANLRPRGATAVMQSRAPSYSDPGWAALLTGAWPDLNDAPPLNKDYETTLTYTQDNLFSAAARSGLKTAVSGYDWFEKLIPADALDRGFFTSGEDHAADLEVMSAALPWLNDGESQFILIHLDQVDYAGHHEGGPQSSAWDAAASRVDAMIGEVMQTLDLSQDTLLICSDHGQIDFGGHGGADEVVLMQPFILAGAGVRAGNYADIQMVDVAPTLAALMGTNLPASSQGRVLAEMLLLPEETKQRIADLTMAQQANLLQSYASALNQPVPQVESGEVSTFQAAIERMRASRLNRERLLRAALAFLILFTTMMLVRKHWKKDNIWLLSGALIYLLVFHLRFRVIDHFPYSYSFIAGPIELVVYLLTTSAIAMLIAWLMVALKLNLFKFSPRQAARVSMDLTLVTAILAALPALWAWTMNGLIPTWTLPDMTGSFWLLFSLSLTLLICLIGLALASFMAGAAWLYARFSQTRHRVL